MVNMPYIEHLGMCFDTNMCVYILYIHLATDCDLFEIV